MRTLKGIPTNAIFELRNNFNWYDNEASWVLTRQQRKVAKRIGRYHVATLKGIFTIRQFKQEWISLPHFCRRPNVYSPQYSEIESRRWSGYYNGVEYRNLQLTYDPYAKRWKVDNFTPTKNPLELPFYVKMADIQSVIDVLDAKIKPKQPRVPVQRDPDVPDHYTNEYVADQTIADVFRRRTRHQEMPLDEVCDLDEYAGNLERLMSKSGVLRRAVGYSVAHRMIGETESRFVALMRNPTLVASEFSFMEIGLNPLFDGDELNRGLSNDY